MIDETTFRRESDHALTALERSLIRAEESFDEPAFETEQKNGVLNVLFEDGSAKFVFTPNTPVAQIWISAQSTSFKLQWNEERKHFALPSTGEDLRTLTERLLREQLGEPGLTLS